jgi:hypothetical protein
MHLEGGGKFTGALSEQELYHGHASSLGSEMERRLASPGLSSSDHLQRSFRPAGLRQQYFHDLRIQ